ncbi:MAG: nucleotidyltransferase [Kiritimatiellia bacterium]
MILIPSDFLDFLKLLSQHQVEYLLIGGYAVAYHGYVRATGDMDIFIRATEKNGERLCAVFQEFGMGQDFNPKLFCKEGQILRLGVPPLRLEILNKISGVSFEECVNDAETLKVDTLSIPVISLEFLLLNKKASGRDKDLIDVKRLERE